MTNISLITSASQTMTSREIADLVESRHDSVKRTIERLADTGVIALPPLVEVSNHGPGPSEIMTYVVGKRDSYVIVAQLSPEFTARLVDRWQELEASQAPKLPQTMAQALRLAAEQAEQIERQQAALAAAAPAVEFVERYVDSTGSKGFRQVCKLLKVKEPEFRAFLHDKNIMYKLGGEWMPFSQHTDAGRFEVKAGTAQNEHAFNSARFTPKGISWVAGEYAKYKLEN
jgi:phage antirepressor YoqD-like protein